MNGDYKYGIQMKAEELAQERFGQDFYDLSREQQDAVYRDASGDYWEGRTIAAERD